MFYNIRVWLAELLFSMLRLIDPRDHVEYYEEWVPCNKDLEDIDNEKCPKCGATFYEGICNVCFKKE